MVGYDDNAVEDPDTVGQQRRNVRSKVEILAVRIQHGVST